MFLEANGCNKVRYVLGDIGFMQAQMGDYSNMWEGT